MPFKKGYKHPNITWRIDWQEIEAQAGRTIQLAEKNQFWIAEIGAGCEMTLDNDKRYLEAASFKYEALNGILST